MTKTEFLLTMSIQYQADKWWELRKISVRDFKLIQYQILQTNITRTVWLTVRRITNKIWEVKGLKEVVLVFLPVCVLFFVFIENRKTSRKKDLSGNGKFVFLRVNTNVLYICRDLFYFSFYLFFNVNKIR